MTPNDGFDTLLTQWLRAQASEQEPVGFHASVAAAAARTRQRRRWIGSLGMALPRIGPWTNTSAVRTATLLVALAFLLALLAAVVGGAVRVAPPPRNGTIAYAFTNDFHLMDPDGSNDRVIGEGRCPTFSADGRVLGRWTSPIHKPGQTQPATLTTTSTEGSAPRTLTGILENPGDNGLALSPDGTQLAFVRPTGSTWDTPRELWVSPVSGGQERRVGPATYPSGLLYHPSWSPDGRSIAVSLHGDYRTAIYVIDSQSGAARVVSTRPGPGSRTDVVWSPDGGSIAFVGVPDEALPPPQLSASSQSPPMDVFVLSLSDGAERNVTHSPEDDSAPRWAPDGRRLAYLKDYATLAIVDTGSWKAAGSLGATPVTGFTWSPDGTTILAYSDLRQNPDGTSQPDIGTTIRTIPLDKSAPWSVTVQGLLSCDPSWQAVVDASPSPAPSATASPVPSLETYRATTPSLPWAYADSSQARHEHTATLLPGGRVLVVGERGSVGSRLLSAEL